jgi:hypothetical protein
VFASRQWKATSDAVPVALAVAAVAGGAAGFILNFIASLMVRIDERQSLPRVIGISFYPPH